MHECAIKKPVGVKVDTYRDLLNELQLEVSDMRKQIRKNEEICGKIIYCKDCDRCEQRELYYGGTEYWCTRCEENVLANDFCSRPERR